MATKNSQESIPDPHISMQRSRIIMRMVREAGAAKREGTMQLEVECTNIVQTAREILPKYSAGVYTLTVLYTLIEGIVC